MQNDKGSERCQQATKAQREALTQSLWEVLVVCVSALSCARTEGKRLRIHKGFQRTLLGTLISFHVETAPRAPLLASDHHLIHDPRG